jgi:acid phosphatase
MFFALLIVVHCISLVQVHGASCTSTQAPVQLRVALRGANAVTISWATPGNSGSNDTPNPQVQYSTSSTLLTSTNSSIGTTSNYNTSSFFHNVPLFNLSPSTKYYYRTLATTLCTNQSSIYSFTTAPAAGNSNPVNIVFVADLGVKSLLDSSGASSTIKALNQVAANTNFFVHNGDISYADDGSLLLEGLSYEQAWNTFQNSIENITAQNIYMTGPGNHEVTCYQEGDSSCVGTPYRNFSAYLNRFRMPGNESGWLSEFMVQF